MDLEMQLSFNLYVINMCMCMCRKMRFDAIPNNSAKGTNPKDEAGYQHQ